MNLLVAILSSSAIATVLSSLIAFYLKRLDFKNEYFKIVIKKRLDAYEKIEYLIASLKTSALDEADQMAYHVPFFNPENFNDFSARLALSNAHNLWLNTEVNQKLSDLNFIFNQIRFEFDITVVDEITKAGKKYYSEIASLRDDIENLARVDLLTLYDFGEINKKVSVGEYQKLQISKKLIERAQKRKGSPPPINV